MAVLTALASSDRSHSLFLARRPATEHDERLLFAFDALIAQIAPEALRSDATGIFRATRVGGAPPQHRSSITATDVLVSVRGAQRVEVLRGRELLDSAGRWVEHRDPCLRMLSALDDGASLIAAHSSEHAMVGAQLQDTDERVWMYLGHAVSLSAALAPFADRITRAAASAERLDVRPANDPRWSVGKGLDADLATIFAHSEVLAAFVADEQGSVVSGQGREIFDPREAMAITERRCAILGNAAVLTGASATSTRVTAGYRVATREERCWCLGSAISGAGRRGSVWILTHPSAGLAIGWACLAALTRATARR